MRQTYLEIGKIVGTHGLRGEMRMLPSCDSPAFAVGFDFLYLDPCGKQKIAVRNARVHKNMCLLTLLGIDTIEQAEAMRGKVLWFCRADADLPEEQWFIAELIGCEVLDAADHHISYGKIADVSQTNHANDVWHIKRESGQELLIPVIDEVVRTVDIDEGKVYITPLAGLFDE
jgi:16S rRNA processing protein RimM